jgi:hypothetical protein
VPDDAVRDEAERSSASNDDAVERARSTASTSTSGQPDEQASDQQFPAEYVRQLREENAERRTAAKAAEERARHAEEALLDLAIAKHASILKDPEVLFLTVKREDLLGDSGLPDPEKIKAAALDLAQSKPYLDARIPDGDIDQGQKGEQPKTFDFSRMLRDAAG